MGHSVEVNHGAYVKARRDALEREQARKALMKLGLGVTPKAKRPAQHATRVIPRATDVPRDRLVPTRPPT
jgi:hypothetical protein